jgi:hypothetical protein
MKIVKISYQKAFATGPFLQEKIGFEAEIEGGNQTAEGCLSLLKEMAERFHREANPLLYQESKQSEMVRSFTPQQTGPSVMPSIDYGKWDKFEIDIENATTPEELETIVKSVDTFPGKLLSVINAKRQSFKK